MESGLSTKDGMHIGKLIKLKDAAKKLSELDHDDVNIFWTMRYCFEEYVKFAIKLPFKINSWEWEGDLLKRKRPAIGKGDLVSTRQGVFFLDPDDVEEVINSQLDEFDISYLHVINNDLERGFMRIQLATDRETLLNSLKDSYPFDPEKSNPEDYELDKAFADSMASLIEDENNENNFITIRTEDIFIWSDDFKNSLDEKNTGINERKSQLAILKLPEISSNQHKSLVEFAKALKRMPQANSKPVDHINIQIEVKALLLDIFGNVRLTGVFIERALEAQNILKPRRTSISEMLKLLG